MLTRFIRRRFRTTWQHATEGGAVLARPRSHLIEVAGVQLASYLAPRA